MKSLVLRKSLVGLLCIFIVLLAAGNLAAAEKSPKIVFKEKSWNFGKVKQGEELKHEFILKNEGETPLNIKNVETSCGCTAALVSEKKIEPGKEGRIKVAFSSKGYAGEVTKFIYVDTDDPREPRVELKILASVDVPPPPKIELDRYTHEAGLLVEGEDLQVRVMVKNKGELELKLECTLPNASFFIEGKSVFFPLKIVSGKEAEILIKLALPNRMGLVREFVLIKSNDPLRSTISMTINGYIVTKDQLKQLFLKYKNILS